SSIITKNCLAAKRRPLSIPCGWLEGPVQTAISNGEPSLQSRRKPGAVLGNMVDHYRASRSREALSLNSGQWPPGRWKGMAWVSLQRMPIEASLECQTKEMFTLVRDVATGSPIFSPSTPRILQGIPELP